MRDNATISNEQEWAPAAGVDDREFRFSQADFRAIAALVREEAGISLLEGKAPLVYARLAKRVRALKLSSFSDYVAKLSSGDSKAERREVLTALTTNVTRFFREPHHFEHLRTEVGPVLVAAARTGARIRLWSAACSTGQEAYSIAAIVAETIPASDRGNVKILATDIDDVVLKQAEVGRYQSIDGVPPASRRWFDRQNDEWVAASELRELITFRALNLNGRWPMRGSFDVVFCRNVAIYFDQDVQSRLWQSFANVVPAGGVLYIGHSERVGGLAADAFDNVGITTYRRRNNNL